MSEEKNLDGDCKPRMECQDDNEEDAGGLRIGRRDDRIARKRKSANGLGQES